MAGINGMLQVIKLNNCELQNYLWEFQALFVLVQCLKPPIFSFTESNTVNKQFRIKLFQGSSRCPKKGTFSLKPLHSSLRIIMEWFNMAVNCLNKSSHSESRNRVWVKYNFTVEFSRVILIGKAYLIMSLQLFSPLGDNDWLKTHHSLTDYIPVLLYVAMFTLLKMKVP